MACERHGCSSLSTILSLASVVTPTATPLSQKRTGLAFAAFKKNADPGPIWEKLAECKTSTKLRLDGPCLDEWQKKARSLSERSTFIDPAASSSCTPETTSLLELLSRQKWDQATISERHATIKRRHDETSRSDRVQRLRLAKGSLDCELFST
ncbi:hypothetical protein EDD36DRAFT_415335 [Exophiala viscosa]|uniref:Uncharacterized protein n=1 Tax=Exophiala viscosa TaxID=2486360 RepID=A0AAN6E1D9_9EURO|nr:hypothetical protein EDD36DRAFT_415335 [Exophiala viscosa]